MLKMMNQVLQIFKYQLQHILSGDLDSHFSLLLLNHSTANVRVVEAINRELVAEFNLAHCLSQQHSR